MYSYAIYHHGIKGQHWGKRNGPPYPLSRSSHNEVVNSGKGKRSGGGIVSTIKTKYKQHKLKKQRLKNLEKARTTREANKVKEQQQAEYEARKQKALKSGSAEEVLKFKGDLTNQQLIDASTRLDFEEKLATKAARDKYNRSNQKKVADAVDKINKMTIGAQKIINAYNVLARIANSSGKFDKEWKILDGRFVQKASQDMNKATQDIKQESTRQYNKEQAKAEKVSGDVVGPGTSRYEKPKNDSYVDAVFRDIPDDNLRNAVNKASQMKLSSAPQLALPDKSSSTESWSDWKKRKGFDIYHHGIKGQHWGKRNGPPYPLSRSSHNEVVNSGGSASSKIKKRKVSRFTGMAKGASIDEEHIIPKGTKMYRATTNANESDGVKYVTYEKPDRQFYSAYTGDRNPGKKVYQQEYKLKNDLKVASLDTYKEVQKEVLKDPKMRKEAIDGYINFLSRNTSDKSISELSKDLDSFCKSEKIDRNALLKGSVYIGQNKEGGFSIYQMHDDSVKDTELKKLKGDDLTKYVDMTYNVASVVSRANEIANDIKDKKIHEFEYTSASLWISPNVKNAMIDKMKERGYNAMVDQAGVGVIKNQHTGNVTREGSSTMIVFDSASDLQKKKTKEVSKEWQDYNYSEYLRWINKNRYRDIKHGFVLSHSAKGSSWEKHKYIKRIDGNYYYPDSYENGRHLPNSNGNAKLHQSQQNQQQQAAGQQNLEAWEKALYDKFAQAFADNPGKYTNEMLTSASEEEFKGALKQFAGIDTDKLSPQQLAEMRKKFDAHYGKVTPSSKSSSQISKSSKSSSKSSSSKSSSSSSKQTSEKSSSDSKSTSKKSSKKKSKDEDNSSSSSSNAAVEVAGLKLMRPNTRPEQIPELNNRTLQNLTKEEIRKIMAKQYGRILR